MAAVWISITIKWKIDWLLTWPAPVSSETEDELRDCMSHPTLFIRQQSSLARLPLTDESARTSHPLDRLVLVLCLDDRVMVDWLL